MQRKAPSHTTTKPWKQWAVRMKEDNKVLAGWKNEHRVTRGPWPEERPQKETHLISITQRWQASQQLATLPLHLPRHHFVFSGADFGLFLPKVTQAGGASIRRQHVHVFLYIMQSEYPVLGISITLSGSVLHDPESRFIFHCLRAGVEGNTELRRKLPVPARLGTFDRNGNCHSYLFTLPSALSCTRRQYEVPTTDREDIWK